VYNLRQAKADIDSIYSTGLFEDVNIVPQEADDSTEAHPKVTGTVWVWWRGAGHMHVGATAAHDIFAALLSMLASISNSMWTAYL
jgi:hypothetical protein